MRSVAIVVMLGLGLAGCADPDGPDGPAAGPQATPSPTPGGEVALELTAAEDRPLARLADGPPVEAYTYCWSGPEAGMCADGFPTAPERFVEIASGGTLRVRGDAETVEAGLAPLRAGDAPAEVQVVEDLSLEGGVATIEARPGRYLLLVSGTFEQGDGHFALGLRVAPD